MANTPNLNIRLSIEQRHAYRELAAATGDTFSNFVRTALAAEAMRRLQENPTDDRVKQALVASIPSPRKQGAHGRPRKN